MTHQFDAVVERDSDGFFVAAVPTLPGCHTRAEWVPAALDPTL